jgi:outer membrane protein TolC
MRKNFLILAVAAALIGTAGPGVGGTEQMSTTTDRTTYSGRGPRVFTLEKAILTAIQQNPDVLRARQEIERAKGVVIQVRAQALPRVRATGDVSWTDPNLNRTGTIGTITTGPGMTPVPTPVTATALVKSPPAQQSDNPPELGTARAVSAARASVNTTDTAYSIRITGQQLVFDYSTLRAIRGTFFQRDSAYFSFRNVLDQTITNTKTQFFQVVVNKALIGVQEESVHLLESQLKDQQNRFEAGTVPRFNVLQAEVALYNQIPQLISARNAYRISQLQLAKTLGLDFDPLRGTGAPLEVVGEMPFDLREIDMVAAIELGKERRPFLKQARANVLNQIEQVHVAIGGWLPNASVTGGYEVVSSPFTTKFSDVSQGWVFGLTGNWDLWNSGLTYGQVKQQRALLSEAKITYDDDVRQVELEIQQAYSNLIQNRELIKSQEKNVQEAEEAVRLAKARLDAGAGTQLDVLNAQVQLVTAQSTRLQALFGYNSSLAEFDRATGAQSVYTETFEDLAPRAAKTRTYYTGSDVNAAGDPKPNALRPGPVRTSAARSRAARGD